MSIAFSSILAIKIPTLDSDLDGLAVVDLVHALDLRECHIVSILQAVHRILQRKHVASLLVDVLHHELQFRSKYFDPQCRTKI